MRYLIYFLIAGNVVAFIIGAMLLLAPQHLSGWVGIGARWLSFRRATRALDMNHNTDPMLMQYPRTLGAVLVLSGAIIFVRTTLFMVQVSTPDGGRLLADFFGGGLSTPAWEVLWSSLLLVVLFGAVLALVIGLLALFNTALLQRVSDFGNRWVSTRTATRSMARTYRPLDRLINGAPRVWGAVIAALAVYAAVMLWWFAGAAG
jgi:hypothetical protein